MTKLYVAKFVVCDENRELLRVYSDMSEVPLEDMDRIESSQLRMEGGWCKTCHCIVKQCKCQYEDKNIVIREPKPEEVNVVVFHKYCVDGFGAAWSAYKKLGTVLPVYMGLTHKEPFPFNNVKNKNVAMFDIAFDKGTMEQIKEVASSFVCYDHHDTAMTRLFSTSNCHFDMDHSGAYLAWKFFHPDRNVPVIISYVEDSDLWQFKLDESRKMRVAIYYECDAFDFDRWDELEAMDLNKLKKHGGHFLKVINKIKKSGENALVTKFGPYTVAIHNKSDSVSETGEHMLKYFPQIDFAIIWSENDKHGTKVLHLRSRSDEKVHVGEIAECFGGGGHPYSASCSFKGSIPELLEEAKQKLNHDNNNNNNNNDQQQ